MQVKQIDITDIFNPTRKETFAMNLNYSENELKEEIQNLSAKQSRLAGELLHEKTVLLMSKNGLSSYEKAFELTLDSNPDLKKLYAH